jgi:hypothetical protein
MAHMLRKILLATISCLAVVALTAATAHTQQPPVRPELPPRATGAVPARPPLPPLSADAQRLVDQWKQDQASIIEQLRFLQLTYRDGGHAEDAAAIAAQVRLMQQRNMVVPGGVIFRTDTPAAVTADLVNEGLPTRDAPVSMSLFRGAGETLSFAVRGRDDQPIWGTTTYTDDSALETAAVHAGLLRSGQSGIVRVRPLPGQDRYDATNQNGVQSAAYGQQRGSYQFVAVAVETRTRTSSLSSYRDLVGHAVTLPAVGTVSSNVWGSDVYTGQPRYEGSPRNGVTSQSYGSFDGSFRVEAAPQPWTVQLPGGEDASRLVPMSTMRGRTGSSFVVQVVGAAAGNVYGTGAYTDDSSIAAAAVHAGLLKPGELGLVRVTIDPAQDSYAGSERNGIKSQSYGKWEGTFRLQRVAR